MKKITTLLAILICFLSYAQDIDFLKQLDHATTEQAHILADSIAVHTSQDFVLYKTMEKENSISFVFIPGTLDTATFNYFKQGEKALVIEFNIYTSKVALNRIVAPYNDLFNVWQHYFKKVPNLEDYANRKIKLNGMAYRIDKDTSFQENVWQIKDTM